eukprot:CAMPEP_0198365822 /NCGR_PEP_ID=MMETSP1450-20131203/154368_1 /TAXON_ID=753684 ORGANISM="Madagascaria erythrocladiodes, Strain CCMP3234" /NCGR_SAMPLE_ID=MMETSP1450 /ASSEMBLY_ACC=CAM_ASM_001115 /LENGTH=295 /DNA_ID=CAMNT_0044073277 /DNA_START=728 /DNA_END=1616 /DNA_ORIENTATION=-
MDKMGFLHSRVPLPRSLPRASISVCRSVVSATARTATRTPLACPNCRAPLGVPVPSECDSCGARFATPPDTAPYADLTLAPPATNTGLLGRLLNQAPAQQELFRSPVVSYLYERGWRRNFRAAGFPGIDVESKLVEKYFEDARGGLVLDMSCGSGLMTRRLVESGLYESVVACDYSEAMLRETELRRVQGGLPEIDLIRADVSQLPFGDDAFNAVHAGAALHCWPKVQDGVREIYRVLKPNGVFFATTFLWFFGGGTRVENRSQPYRFFDRVELEWIMKSAGFEEVDESKRSDVL